MLTAKEKQGGGNFAGHTSPFLYSISPKWYSCLILLYLCKSRVEDRCRIDVETVHSSGENGYSIDLGKKKKDLTTSKTNHHANNICTNNMSIPTSLTKQILQLNHPQQKFSNESIELTSEFMKLFIVEARRRASIQVC